MHETFTATLRGNVITWDGNMPAPVRPDEPVKVLVTVLAEPVSALNPDNADDNTGKTLAAILASLAALPDRTEIPDPRQWQQEMRRDRVLAGWE